MKIKPFGHSKASKIKKPHFAHFPRPEENDPYGCLDVERKDLTWPAGPGLCPTFSFGSILIIYYLILVYSRGNWRDRMDSLSVSPRRHQAPAVCRWPLPKEHIHYHTYITLQGIKSHNLHTFGKSTNIHNTNTITNYHARNQVTQFTYF